MYLEWIKCMQSLSLHLSLFPVCCSEQSSNTSISLLKYSLWTLIHTSGKTIVPFHISNLTPKSPPLYKINNDSRGIFIWYTSSPQLFNHLHPSISFMVSLFFSCFHPYCHRSSSPVYHLPCTLYSHII